MSAAAGLRRQVVLTMSAVTLAVVVLCVLGSYAFYALLLTFHPASVSDGWMPSSVELAWVLLTLVVAMLIAIFVATRLSRRILPSLDSVAISLRQLAEGDLSARASTDDSALHEAAQLVHDFNSLAQRLEGMAQERAFWSAAIAHELRTPVTILSGRLQGLSDGVFLPSKDMLASLMTQVEGLTRLIDDLRLLGLQDNGHLHLELRQTCLAGEVRSVTLAVGPALEQAGLQLALELDEQPVVCDPVRIRQALLALLENAMLYAQPGPLLVAARVRQGLCTVRVEDSGPGVAADLAPRIFDAFQRGEGARSRKNAGVGASKGSGLGLAVVQAIAQAHGGRAQCLPGERGGALFELSWPA